jgi:3-hydroxyacyl-CoA dehydrogenase
MSNRVESLPRIAVLGAGHTGPVIARVAVEAGYPVSIAVGSPETVARKIAANLTALGASRFDLKYGMGGLSHDALMTNIELYGTRVIPRVRELIATEAA